jgi:hypothetical protein
MSVFRQFRVVRTTHDTESAFCLSYLHFSTAWQFIFFLLLQPFGIPLLYLGMILASVGMFANKQTTEVQAHASFEFQTSRLTSIYCDCHSDSRHR